ncbi:hypothetical protein Slala03_07850 [Streptomyces lavendulae subsp. lavendulae]|nr:hypothetical protein Slala03_07850 [Streptomyces lavendulae subsp. lavendulae]
MGLHLAGEGADSVDDERGGRGAPGDRVQGGQEPLGYVHEQRPLQHLVDGRRAPAGLLAHGYRCPGSAFPGPCGLPRGPSGSPQRGVPGRGPGTEQDFPITVARAAPVSHRFPEHQGQLTLVARTDR